MNPCTSASARFYEDMQDLFRVVVIRRLDAKEVLAEEVYALAMTMMPPASVAPVGNNDEFEVLVGTDEGIGEAHGGLGRDVAIQFSHDEEESALQSVSVVDIR